MELLNEMVKIRDAGAGGTAEWDEAVDVYLRMLAPAAPHIPEELWQRRGKPYSIHQQSWPEVDEQAAAEEMIVVVVQVNGKLRDRLTVPVNIGDMEFTPGAFNIVPARVDVSLEFRSPEQAQFDRLDSALLALAHQEAQRFDLDLKADFRGRHAPTPMSDLIQQSFSEAPFALVNGESDLQGAAQATGFPAILKVSRFGYDGKGQYRVASMAELQAAFAELKGIGCVLEGFVTLDCEVSVVLGRGDAGECRTWPVGENRHEHGILDVSIVPARVPGLLAQEASIMARRSPPSSSMSGSWRWNSSCPAASCWSTKSRRARTTPGTTPWTPAPPTGSSSRCGCSPACRSATRGGR